jgi:hypothetical protein
MLTETALHAQRHKRVLASRSRIALKARRDTQLRLEAGIKRHKSSQWFEELAAAQRENEVAQRTDQAKAMTAARQRQTQKGWLAGAAAKAMSFLRRGR